MGCSYITCHPLSYCSRSLYLDEDPASPEYNISSDDEDSNAQDNTTEDPGNEDSNAQESNTEDPGNEDSNAQDSNTEDPGNENFIAQDNNIEDQDEHKQIEESFTAAEGILRYL